MPETEIEERTRYLSDRLAILDVVTRYFNSVDRRDIGLLRTCFTDDVEVIIKDTPIGGGLDGFIAYFEGAEKRSVDLQSPHYAMHFMGNHRAEVSDGEATSETYALAHLIDHPAAGPRLRTRGLRYSDRLTRQDDGRWLIARRVHEVDWMTSNEPLAT